MGAKYLPTIKDQKASRRFQKKLHVASKFIKASGKTAANPRKKK